MPVQRQDQFAVSVSLDSESLGLFDTFSGGETDSDDAKYRPGGLSAEEAVGGPPTVGNVTVSRAFRRERDVALRRWRNRIGRALAVVKVQPLDNDGNVYGSPETYKGLLKRLTPPEHDSNSSDPAVVELEIVCDETVA